MGIYKMKKYFEYNGYRGSVEHSVEDMVLHGEILFIGDLVTYEAEGISELRKEFESAVDDYLQTCQEFGKDPDKPFTGSFQVRITPELHRAAAIQSHSEVKALSKYVSEAIEEKLSNKALQVSHNHTPVVTHKIVVDVKESEQEKIQWDQNIQFSNISTQPH